MFMEVRRYKPSDYKDINSWYLKRKMPSMPESILPKTGFIVDGIGAGFLYKTDGGIAILENFISNPESSHEERVEVLDMVTEALVLEAIKSGYYLGIAFSKHPTVAKNCLKHNFKLFGTFELFAKEL